MLSKQQKESSELIGGRFNVIGSYIGGMAEVLILQDIINRRIVAAKTPHIAEDHFSRESRLWLGLGRHPNIVRAHTVYNFKNRPFLFMDFIGDQNGSSRNLRTVLDVSANKLVLIVKTAIAVIRALRHADSVFPGFVHRDLKPENILIDANEKPYVSDFGIGHIQKPILNVQGNKNIFKYSNIISGSTILTKEGSFVGTPGYAAPEQYFDSSTVTFQTDLYALGIIVFEALTGRLPYPPEILERDGLNLMKLPFKKPSYIQGELQTLLWNMTKSLLAFNPADRPKSFDIVESALLKLEDKHISLGEEKSEQAEYKLDEQTFVNRVNSLIELNDYRLATLTLFQLLKKYPFSLSYSALIKKIRAHLHF